MRSLDDAKGVVGDADADDDDATTTTMGVGDDDGSAVAATGAACSLLTLIALALLTPLDELALSAMSPLESNRGLGLWSTHALT